MADETKLESGPESEERCRDKEHWHKHHHKHSRGWHGGPMTGSLWFIGWLFSIGYLQMPFFWKGVLALIIWPYYLGRALVH
jgi:hypothetical protein